ncbi:unnamed protein product [Linum tenue]|uniref:Cytochrome P450 n=1 Tax=Linum tenue TaxID=586396 RepID=A0AAV0R7F4_9ROSI|nr:unnamed protein product [Linum tenue]
MESKSHTLSATLLLLIILSIILFIVKRKNPKAKKTPAPWKLPVIGHMHHLAAGGGITAPHVRLRDLARIYGPVMELQLGEISHVLISSVEAARQVFKTQDLKFAQRPSNIATGIITYNGADLAQSPYNAFWRQLRKLCTLELLSAKQVQSFRPVREEQALEFVREIASASTGAVVNLSKRIFYLTYGVTSRTAFGEVCKDREAYIPVAADIMVTTGGFMLADFFPSWKLLQWVSGLKARMERLHRAQDNLLRKIIHDHRMRKCEDGDDRNVGAEDLVDGLLKLQRNVVDQQGFTLTDKNIKGVIGDMFIAGSDTSSATVEWAMSELIKNPTIMKKAQEEKLVIKETLRLHIPAPILIRECIEECEVGGHLIPIGTRVLINSWAIARDPTAWDQPEEFRPERFMDGAIDYRGTNFEYLPFGAGRRMCPGISFGIANVQLPLANLLFYFNWELPNGEKFESLDMDGTFGITVKRTNELNVVPILRYPIPVAV